LLYERHRGAREPDLRSHRQVAVRSHQGQDAGARRHHVPRDLRRSMHLPRRLAAALADPLAPYALALAAQIVFVGYIKDDAYIEYRYATNAAHGHGLTF